MLISVKATNLANIWDMGLVIGDGWRKREEGRRKGEGLNVKVMASDQFSNDR